MGFLNRAFLYIRRQKRKALILSVLIFILGTAMSGAIVVKSAIHQTEHNLWVQMPPVATISLDFVAGQIYSDETGNEPEWERSLTPEEIRQIGELPYVTSFEYSFTHAFWNHEFKFYNSIDDWWRDAGSVSVKGISNPNLMDIREGIIEIVDGRPFTVSDMIDTYYTALISQEFAELNNLTIGSMISLESRIYTERWVGFDPSDWRNQANIETSQVFDLEVIGIFEILKELEFEPGVTHADGQTYDFPSQEEVSFNQLINQIYVPMNLLEMAPSFNFEALVAENSINSFFILDDPFDMPEFVRMANALLPGGWIVIEPSGHFNRILASFNTMQQIADVIFISTILTSCIILSLLMLLLLHERRHEIGIYLALGEHKQKIILQLLIENISLAMIAFMLAIFAGNIISRNVSRIFLKQNLLNQIENAENGFFTNMVWHGVGEIGVEELISRFEIGLDVSAVFVILGVGLMTVLFSAGISAWLIVKLSPKKVLL